MTNPIELTMGMSPYLQMGRMDIPAAMEEEFNAWYNTVYVPGYMTVPGCIRARRYLCIEGQPKYLTLYEFENPKVPETDAWRTVGNSNPWTQRVRPNLQHGAGSPGVYARIYPDPVG